MGQIEIENRAKNDGRTFESLDIGEVFECSGTVYIKTSNRDSGEDNVFNLKEYCSTYFLSGMIVTPLTATLVIE